MKKSLFAQITKDIAGESNKSIDYGNRTQTLGKLGSLKPLPNPHQKNTPYPPTNPSLLLHSPAPEFCTTPS